MLLIRSARNGCASEITFKVTQDIVDKLDINNRHDNTMQLLSSSA